MTQRPLLFCVLLIFASCSIPTEQPAAKKADPAPMVKPSDESRRFPAQGRVQVEIVDDHLFGKEFLPGGNVAEYSREGETYQLFVAEAKSSEAAALLMFDYKSALAEAKFIAHMGGYFGMDGEQPVYLFAKGKWVAGVVGLPQDEADPVARDLAARLD